MSLRSQRHAKWLEWGIIILGSVGKKRSKLLRSPGTQDVSLVPCSIRSHFGALSASICPTGYGNKKNLGYFLGFYTWYVRRTAVCSPSSRYPGWTLMTRCLLFSHPSLVSNHHLKIASMGNYRILSINYSIWKIYNIEHMLLMIFLLWKVKYNKIYLKHRLEVN